MSVTRILLIEDNDLNRDMLSRRLRRCGIEVLLAADARHGIEVATVEQPDLILMDLRLPDMSGWDAARLLKHNEETRRIPLIALTAHAMQGDREKAIEVGCDDYDIKPIDLPRLLEKIRIQLDKSAERNCRGEDTTGSSGADSLPLGP